LGLGKKVTLGNEAVVRAASTPPIMVAPLAVRLIRGTGQTFTPPEANAGECGTCQDVRFVCALPLEFAETFCLENSHGALDTAASVVAVPDQSGRCPVVARFTRDVPNWIVKP